MKRGPYALWGLGLFFFKYNVDRLLVARLSRQAWFPWSYFSRADFEALDSSASHRLVVVLILTSLPFVAVGFVFTLRRLRNLGWSPLWALLFFAPYANLVFFFLLSLLPGRREDEQRPVTWLSVWKRIFSFRSAWGSAGAAVAVTAMLNIPLVLLATLGLQDYAWGLFLGTPFASGFFAALFHATSKRRTWLQCVGVGMLSIVVTAGLLLLLAVEGAICIAMAAPVAIVFAILGATVGYFLQRDIWRKERPAGVRLYVYAWIVLPTLFLAEKNLSDVCPLRAVTTTEEINAPIDVVWQHVVSFSEIPEPKEWVFLSGIAYPRHARIEGSGVGAVRYCEFSTGPFVEPITVWDRPRRLAFDVSAEPEPMREMSPYHDLHPPHLDGFFRSKRGQFLLVELPGGHTRLEGTTWYEQKIQPQLYWTQWSDWLVHTIHRRVLQHIKAEAEADISRGH